MDKPTGRRAGTAPKQLGKIGAVRRELVGTACPHCGWRKYQLVLRSNVEPGKSGLFARCSQCQRSRSLNDDLQRILWV